MEWGRAVRRSHRQQGAASSARRSVHRRSRAGAAATCRLRAFPDLLADPNHERLSQPVRGAACRPSRARPHGGPCMKCVLFYHAFSSCWNNGNAHFLRGGARELHALGHDVLVYEPADGWSRLNAIRDGGSESLREVTELIPGVSVRSYNAAFDLDSALDGADLVLVHEWNEPDLIKRIGRHRIANGRYTLLFHDTHHRAVTAPEDLARFDLSGYDAVLAFGEVLRQIYLGFG